MTTISRRTAVAAAFVALPFLAEPVSPNWPYAAQQQAYLDGLGRAAQVAAAEPAAGSAFSAQQLAYTEHLDQAAQAARLARRSQRSPRPATSCFA